MKKITAVLLMFLTTVALFGCSQDYLQNYKEAVEKTESRKFGKERIAIKIENEFNEENISQEILEELNYLKNIQVEVTSSFNESQDESKVYIKYRGLGYDLTIFSSEEQSLIYVPMIGRYIQLKEEDLGFDDNMKDLEELEALTSKIKEEWLNLLQKENVVKGKKDIMTTKDGDVKVDLYTIQPSEEQTRLFLKKIFALLRSEEKSLGKLVENENDDIDIANIIDNIEKAIEKFEKITFKNKAYIDIDGYIVKEYIDITLEDYDPKPGSNSIISVNVEVENWENEVEQKIKIPEVDQEEIMDIDKINDDIQNFLN
ncbi:MAG: hypothetical protein R6U59_08140 [Eubacteriales bacterium]